jgi:uncharacterized protein (TIGR03437 family)
MKSMVFYFACCAAASITAGHAQYLVTFQGPAIVSQDPTVSFFDPTTLNPGGTLSVPGAFQFLSLSDGSELYFITNNTGAAITVLHPKARTAAAAVAGQHNIGNFANPLNCAALSPDGSRLVVGENAVHIIDTGSNVDLTPNGIGVGAGATVIGVVVSYDSQTAFALATYNGTSYLAAIGIAQLAVTNSITFTGTASALAQGPNALLYVGLPGQLLEINPATLSATPNGTLTINATPGPLAFTPDGNYLVAANQTYGTQPALLLLNLNNHLVEGEVPFTGLAALATSPLTGTTAVFDSLYMASPYTVYPFSSGGQSLFTLQIGSNGGLVLDIPVIAGITDSAQAAMALSNDLGLPGRNYPQFLFTVTDGALDPSGNYSLNRIDPASSLLTSQALLLSTTPGAVAYYAPTFTGNTPVTVLQYGNNQTLLPGGVSLPLVVRVLDQNGLPISGAGINFDPSAGTVNPANTVTGADGYAQAIYTAGSAPTDIGSITITATAEGVVSQSFSVTVGTGQTIYPAALTVVSGQGQLVLEDLASGTPPFDNEPLVVLATDVNGNPLPGTLVTFTATSGAGVLLAPDGSSQPAVVSPADSSGQASITFVPPLVGSFPGFQGDVVTASVTVPGSSSGTTSTISQNFNVTTMPLDIGYCQNPPCTPIIPLIVQVLQPATGTVLKGTADATLPDPVLVQVYAATGIPIPNIGVKVSTGNFTTLPNASCAGSNNAGLALTNASGLATCNVVLNGVPGTEPLTISVPGIGYGNGSGVVLNDYTLTIVPGAPANVNILAGNNQVGIKGSKLPLPFIVQVTDAGNNPIPGVPVSWNVTAGSLILSGITTTTGPTGKASATGTPLSAGGSTITLQVTAASVSATFTVLVEVPPASINIVSGNNQSAPINAPLGAPLVVQLLDGSNNPASYAPVVFTSSATQILSATSVTADVNGMASTTVTSVGPIAGTSLVDAINGAGKSALIAKFSITALPPGPQGPSVLNSATFAPGIAPGCLVTFIGLGLTPTIQGVVTDPSQMQGYAVSFDGIPAPILALVNQNGTQQINAQVPFEESPGPSDTITIETPQGSATLSNITVNTLAPGIFTSGTLTAYGQNYALAEAVRPDGSLVSASNPAQRGENITFFATGLGQTVPSASTGVLGQPGQIVGGTLYAGVNNQGDAVVSAIYEPNALGLYAVTIQIPSTTTPGPVQPLGLLMLDATGASYSAQPAYLPIQ